MGVLRVGVCLVAFCTLTADVRADMSRLFAEPEVMFGSESRAGGATVDADAGGFLTGTLDAFPLIDSTFRFSSSVSLWAEEPVSGPVFSIPPPPSSLKLFLSGMFAIGAWHGVRAGRQIALGGLPIPEWYHDGGPAQIGHATPFDLDFSNLPLRRFDTVDDGIDQAPLRNRLERARDALHKPQFLLAALADPRGPPFFTV